MFASHLSDELLVRYLDGECSRLQTRLAQRHVKTCWSCRARLAEFDQQMREVAKAIQDRDFPGPGWVAFGLLKLEDRRREFERVNRLPHPIGRPAFITWSALAVAALLIVCTGMALLFRYRNSADPAEAAAMLARAEGAESTLAQRPVHQEFRVELSQTKPERRQTTTLELWSEPRMQRFTSQWRQQDGTLKYAVWNAGAGRAFAYAAADGSGLRPSNQPPDGAGFSTLLTGAAAEDVEAFFARWLMNRGWRPISLARDLIWFLGRDGAMLRMERIALPDGRNVVRLSAVRESHGVRAAMTLEIDAMSFRPRLQMLYVQSRERTLRVKMTAETYEVVEAPRMVSAVFEPHIPGTTRTRLPAPPPSQPALSKAPSPGLGILSASELDALEIEVRYALHRGHVCLGEPVLVSRTPGGTLRVSGLVETESRKQSLLALLATVSGASSVAVEIKTIREAAMVDGASAQAHQPAAALAKREPAAAALAKREPAAAANTDPPASRFPIDRSLQSYLSRVSSAAGRPRSVAEFSTRSVLSAHAALAEAWALRRLAERYPREAEDGLDPKSRSWLYEMVREHVGAMRLHLADYRELVEPAFTALAAELGSEPNAAAPVAPRDEHWSVVCIRLFGTMQRMDAVTAGLLTGGKLSLSPADALAEVVASLPSLEEEMALVLTAAQEKAARREPE